MYPLGVMIGKARAVVGVVLADHFKAAGVPLPSTDPDKRLTWDQAVPLAKKVQVEKNGVVEAWGFAFQQYDRPCPTRRWHRPCAARARDPRHSVLVRRRARRTRSGAPGPKSESSADAGWAASSWYPSACRSTRNSSERCRRDLRSPSTPPSSGWPLPGSGSTPGASFGRSILSVRALWSTPPAPRCSPVSGRRRDGYLR